MEFVIHISPEEAERTHREILQSIPIEFREDYELRVRSALAQLSLEEATAYSAA